MSKTETQKGNLIYLPIEKLKHHPQNPRKDLGDLSELAESIKQNGVFQNLTVVPWFSELTGVGVPDCKAQEEMGYFVVIGNRRLEAAKIAGLLELPCVIADMTHQQQVSTMLVENMQRSDLTVYEQAQGFQLMLDLGETLETITDKTGFSESTVRRRIKLLDLDKEKFKESEVRGASLNDYLELDKIKDTKRKNKVLETIGTKDFNYQLKKAIDEEKTEEKLSKIIEVLKTFANEIKDASDSSKWSFIKSYYDWDLPETVKIPEDKDSVEYVYCKTSCTIRLFKRKTEAEKNYIEKQAENLKQAEEKRLENKKILEDIAQRSYKLRMEFAKSVSSATIKKHLADILSIWIHCVATGTDYIDCDDVIDFLDIKVTETETSEEVYYSDVFKVVEESPERSLWFMVYLYLCDDEDNHYFQSYHLYHTPNENLDRIYDILIKLGYQMSEEEQQMRDGTHPNLRKKE